MSGKKLVVFIPALNEDLTIAKVIKSIPKKISGISKIDVLVVDDGSIDKTVIVSKRAGAIVVSHNRNKGLGVAFRTGINHALKLKADIVVNIDADNQFNSNDIPKLVLPILENKADVVTCSRFLDPKLVPEMPWIKRFGNSLFTNLMSFLTGQKFSDTQCGFRAYSKDACLRMTLFGVFTYTQEALIDLTNKGFRIKEVACKVKGERQGKSRIVSNWYSYGLRALIIIIRTMRDWEPLKFFGGLGLIIGLFGVFSGLFVFIHWLSTTQTSPYTSLIPVSAAFLVIGFMLGVLALIADMLDRQRKIQEEILLRMKRKELE
jgi:glycosyltransferase involved in cell wall biosynthesis